MSETTSTRRAMSQISDKHWKGYMMIVLNEGPHVRRKAVTARAKAHRKNLEQKRFFSRKIQ